MKNEVQLITHLDRLSGGTVICTPPPYVRHAGMTTEFNTTSTRVRMPPMRQFTSL